jgi:hypothetical protein
LEHALAGLAARRAERSRIVSTPRLAYLDALMMQQGRPLPTPSPVPDSACTPLTISDVRVYADRIHKNAVSELSRKLDIEEAFYAQFNR